MTAEIYGEALYKAVTGGMAPQKAISGLREVLKAHGRSPLYHAALQNAQTRFLKDESSAVASVTVARESDEKKFSADIKRFLKEQGVEDMSITIDENIIGGFIAESRGHRLDASYKKSLLTIYKSLTA